MLATYERKKVTEYTSFNYEFKVFYKDEYVCDLLKIGRHEWAFSAFQSCDKLEGLQMFLYNKIKLFFVIYDKPAFNTLFSFKE